jgi:hypothetical protein
VHGATLSETEQLVDPPDRDRPASARGERVLPIARDLYLSQSTVRNHLTAAFQRLGVHFQEGRPSLVRNERDDLST